MATDFSSLDKLMEFGLGVGIASQMMNTMNNVIANTAVPGVGINAGIKSPAQSCQAPAMPLKKEYYIVHEDRVAGPLNEEELTKLVKIGHVGNKTFCWSPGMKSWQFAQDIPAINKILLLNS